MATDPIDKLLSALDDAILLRRRSDEAHWANWLEKDRRLIANGDYYGVEPLAGWAASAISSYPIRKTIPE